MASLSAVLDAWAIITVAKREAGAQTTREAIRGGAVVSWITLGEVYYSLAKQLGEDRAQEVIDAACMDARAEVPDGRFVLDAARIRARGGLSYADAFVVALAHRHRLPILTGDPALIEREDVTCVDLRAEP